jgi:hypothetical protein
MNENAHENQWYVRTENGASGPYTAQQIRDFAANDKILPVSMNREGPWTVLDPQYAMLFDPKTGEKRYGSPILLGCVGVVVYFISGFYFWNATFDSRDSPIYMKGKNTNYESEVRMLGESGAELMAGMFFLVFGSVMFYLCWQQALALQTKWSSDAR